MVLIGVYKSNIDLVWGFQLLPLISYIVLGTLFFVLYSICHILVWSVLAGILRLPILLTYPIFSHLVLVSILQTPNLMCLFCSPCSHFVIVKVVPPFGLSASHSGLELKLLSFSVKIVCSY